MSHDIDIVDTPDRTVSLSFTAGGQGCWVFVYEGAAEEVESKNVRLTQDEALAAAKYILEFYA